MNLTVPIGKDIDTGEFRFISELNKEEHKGLACRCVCVGCGSDLIARFSEKRVNHFAHRKATDATNACGETALHLLAKELIIRNEYAYIPPITEKSSTLDLIHSTFETITNFFGKTSKLKALVEEKTLSEYQIKPDVLAVFDVEGESFDLAIEVAVTHFVDEEKVSKITESALCMIELDLSSYFAFEGQLTQEKVLQYIKKNENWSWVHIPQRLAESLNRVHQEVHFSGLAKHNATIKGWRDSLESSLTNSTLKLPHFLYRDVVATPRIEDDSGSSIPAKNIAKKPNVSIEVEVLKVSDFKKGAIELTLSISNGQHVLPLVIASDESERLKAEEKSHLIIRNVNQKLPDTQKLNLLLSWGYNKKAKDYERYVVDEVEKQQKEFDSRVVERQNDEIKIQLNKYHKYFFGNHKYISSDLKRIKDQEKLYLNLMKSHGIKTDTIFYDIKDSWIFGCGNSWQTFVMYIMCVDGSAHGRAGEIYRYMKRKDFKLYPLWPLSFLHRKKHLLNELNYDMKRLIDPEVVIREYLEALVNAGLLNRPYGSEFEKRFRCGRDFKTK